jgi:toxin ParE1/3/4
VELKIVFSKTAIRDLKEIFEYIKIDSLKYARREAQLIRAVVKKLNSNSFLGRKFEKADDELTRELIFKNYRIIYDIVPGIKIYFLSIHHHSRLIANNPAFASEE